MHIVFEVLLVVALILAWPSSGVRVALVVALVSHAAARTWSALDFIPKRRAFERSNPADVDAAAAVGWTRRSLLRLPLDVVTAVAMLAALALA